MGSRPGRHNKGVKNGTGSSLADDRIKRVKRQINRYFLCRKIAHELIMSVKNNKRRSIRLLYIYLYLYLYLNSLYQLDPAPYQVGY